MRVIEYFDRIHRQKIELEVTDEVALFLQSSSKKWQRSQNEYNYRTISLDTVVYSGESEDVTLEETIPSPEEDEVMDCKTCKQKLRFYNIVWKVVGNLDKDKYDLVWDFFVLGKSQKQLATEKGITESALSQLLSTIRDDLVYHFNCDKEFTQTNYYKEYFKREMQDVKRIAQTLTPEEIGGYIMNGVLGFTKLATQVFKKSTILNKDIEYKDKFSKINRVVKQSLEQLNLDNSINKTFTIPDDLINKENKESIIRNINKFLK
ncbi:MAG: hypothetical protein MSA34_02920 [Firmicutes bacterium]|nr:hypothetical protein [Bacillota bacterium]MDY5586036.1 hypothetical protein [Eubacteriales bacterium]